MDVTEEKVECTVRFFKNGGPGPLTEDFNCLLHLFQHQYDEHSVFWYGVADVACKRDQYEEAYQRANGPGEFGNLHIDIHFANGQHASAYTTSSLQRGDAIRVSFLGLSSLPETFS